MVCLFSCDALSGGCSSSYETFSWVPVARRWLGVTRDPTLSCGVHSYSSFLVPSLFTSFSPFFFCWKLLLFASLVLPLLMLFLAPIFSLMLFGMSWWLWYTLVPGAWLVAALEFFETASLFSDFSCMWFFLVVAPEQHLFGRLELAVLVTGFPNLQSERKTLQNWLSCVCL